MPNDKEFELDDLESFSFDDLSPDDAPPPSEPVAGEDPFGVWVKSAPEDVADEPVEPEALDDLPEEDFLSSEELASLDDSFDFVTVSDEPMEGETPLEDEIAYLDTPEAVAAEKASTTGASFDEISLDDFVSFDDVSIDDVPAFITEVPSSPEAGTDEELSEEFLDIDIDIEDDIGDEELEIIEGAAPKSDVAEEISLDSFSAQEVDLSEFGDFEEVSPVEEGPLALGEDLPEVMDLPEMPSADEMELDDIELPEEIDLSALAEAADDGFFEETILDAPLTSMVDEGTVTLDLEPDDQTDLDHIMALEEDLTAGIRPVDSPAVPAAAAATPNTDLAALILGKIEQELSSIKQEISDLKKEVTHLRLAPAPVAEPQPLTPEIAEIEAEAKPHGFFDEEDDETIALTGDELDNILSTAEISEGEEQGLSLDEDVLTIDDLLSTDEEGNLLVPEVGLSVEPEAAEVLHVTDEEFLSGTALDLNEPELEIGGTGLGIGETNLGIPESIELEEGFPLELEEGQTEDLLGSFDGAEDFEVSPLPEGLLEGNPEPLEIPFDDDIGLELDAEPLAPALSDLDVPAVAEDLTELPELDLPSLDSDAEGWSPTPLALDGPEEEEMLLSLEEELPPAPTATAQAPIQPSPPTASSGSLTPGVKEELKAVLQYMDKLLASLPDDKIQEFAESEHFEVYKRLFEELGLIE